MGDLVECGAAHTPSTRLLNAAEACSRDGTRYQTVILEQAPEAQEVSMNSQRSIDSELLEEESSETLDDESSFDEPGGETTR